MGARIELHRIAIGVGERVGDRALCQPQHLGEHSVRGFGIQIAVRARIQQRVDTQHLEQVELDIPKVRLVVRHAPGLLAIV